MSDSTKGERTIAYVAIRKHKGGGATFAYLPNTEIKLPTGWDWAVIDGEIDTEDVSYHIDRGMSLDATCRMMCSHTGITWPEVADEQ